MNAGDWDAAYATESITPVDTHLQDVAGELAVGTALDLGCGAGQNSIWLAQQGWVVTGLDFAATAIAQALAASVAAGVRVEFEVADLTEWEPSATYDLVVSTYALPPKGPGRAHALRSAANAVAPGGTLLISEFDESLAGRGWMAEEDLVAVAEILGFLDGFEVPRAEVEVTRHAHGEDERRLPVALLVARRPEYA